MTMRRKKKSIAIISLTATILLAGVLYVFMTLRSSQTKIQPQYSQGAITILPLQFSPFEVELIPGLRFKIDTGSDVSTITEADLSRLVSLGLDIRTSIYPVVGRDGDGAYRLEFTRHTVTLPLLKYTVTTDSMGHVTATASKKSLNLLYNVDFVPSRTGQSVLGIDFLERFKCEYRYADRTLALHLNMPDGYIKCVPLKYSRNAFYAFCLSKRYYMPIELNGVKRRFFANTGLREASIVLPMKDSHLSTASILLTDTIENALGRFGTYIEKGIMVQVGNRIGTANAYYCDAPEEKYTFNPFIFFTQDAVLDFADGWVYLRPIYNRPATVPQFTEQIFITE